MLINLGLLCVFVEWFYMIINQFQSANETPPQQSPSAKQAYTMHFKLGHLWRLLHTRHYSLEGRALICAKAERVFYPHPIWCDKPSGAELMLLKSRTRHHVLLSILPPRRRRKSSCKCTQRWVGEQRNSALRRTSSSSSSETPILKSLLWKQVYVPPPSGCVFMSCLCVPTCLPSVISCFTFLTASRVKLLRTKCEEGNLFRWAY